MCQPAFSVHTVLMLSFPHPLDWKLPLTEMSTEVLAVDRQHRQDLLGCFALRAKVSLILLR